MFKAIKAEELNENVFKMIGTDWLLVTAEKEGKANTMTASWGAAGIMWGKPCAFVFIRPQRYTKEFVDAGDVFTLTFFDGEKKKEMSYLGSVSGRDEDKITKAGLHVEEVDGAPTFSEGKIVIVCKKLMETPLNPADFKENWIEEKWYPAKDYHIMYTAEILAAYRIEE